MRRVVAHWQHQALSACWGAWATRTRAAAMQRAHKQQLDSHQAQADKVLAEKAAAMERVQQRVQQAAEKNELDKARP